jgi:hypothetical protein
MTIYPVNIAMRNSVHHDEVTDTEQCGRHWARLCSLKAVLQIGLLHVVVVFVALQPIVVVFSQPGSGL